jgi:hypothetical protein
MWRSVAFLVRIHPRFTVMAGFSACMMAGCIGFEIALSSIMCLFSPFCFLRDGFAANLRWLFGERLFKKVFAGMNYTTVHLL